MARVASSFEQRAEERRQRASGKHRLSGFEYDGPSLIAAARRERSRRNHCDNAEEQSKIASRISALKQLGESIRRVVTD